MYKTVEYSSCIFNLKNKAICCVVCLKSVLPYTLNLLNFFEFLLNHNKLIACISSMQVYTLSENTIKFVHTHKPLQS